MIAMLNANDKNKDMISGNALKWVTIQIYMTFSWRASFFLNESASSQIPVKEKEEKHVAE